MGPLPRGQRPRNNPADITKDLQGINTIGNAPTNAAYRVVDGPSPLSKFVSDQYDTFTANPHDDGYRAHIKNIPYRYETSGAALFAALPRTQLASASLPTSHDADQGQLKGRKRDVAPYRTAFKDQGIGSTFKNLYVRQALEMGIPQQPIIAVLYKGPDVQIHGPVPRTPKNKGDDPSMPTPSTRRPARRCCKKWVDREQPRVMTKNGVTLALTLLYPAGSTTEATIVQRLKRDWSQERIDVALKGTPFEQVVATEGPGAHASKWAMMNSLINVTYAPATTSQATARMNACEPFAAKHLPVLWMPEPTGYNKMAT